MIRDEQVQFVNSLLESIGEKIINNITTEKIPADWNGIQLRQYIEDKAKECNWRKMTRSEKQSYNNDTYVNNL